MDRIVPPDKLVNSIVSKPFNLSADKDSWEYRGSRLEPPEELMRTELPGEFCIHCGESPETQVEMRGVTVEEKDYWIGNCKKCKRVYWLDIVTNL